MTRHGSIVERSPRGHDELTARLRSALERLVILEANEAKVIDRLSGIDFERCEAAGYDRPTGPPCTPEDPCRIHAIRVALGFGWPSFWRKTA